MKTLNLDAKFVSGKKYIPAIQDRGINKSEPCNKPTRQGFYVTTNASGLSGGSVYFVGSNQNNEPIIELVA